MLEWRAGEDTHEAIVFDRFVDHREARDPVERDGETTFLGAVAGASSAQPSRARSPYARFVKRGVDLVGASVLLVVLSPVLVAIWLSLRLTLGPRVVLRQERVGRHGRTYPCLKFRTMANCRRRRSHGYTGPNRRRTHKSDDDPRHTRLGRFLRRHSFDELLQLVNVVWGDMSLVGPRPEMATVASPSFIGHPRHRVRPGLTGPYQVSEHRGSGQLVDGLPLDEHYVASVSFLTDLRLVMATVMPIARGSGS